MGKRVVLHLQASGNTGGAGKGKDSSHKVVGFGTFQPPSTPLPSIYEQAKLNDYKKLQDQYDSGERRVLDDTVDFPCEFTIKIIGVNEKSFAPDVVNTVSVATGIIPEAMKVSVRETSGKKYVSITLVATYASADEVYAAYQCISKDTRVKYVI